MKKLLFLVAILSFLSLILPKFAFGAEKMNKFGIHILEVSDLPKAQELVNSSGGDWGWVTMVIRDDDMNFDKWQDFFDQCRSRHLVPIVRIATHTEGQSWIKPSLSDSQKWVDFLGNLNWPVKNRYVIIFNEPNHAKEWGGQVNPEEYAKILSEFILKLKAKNQNFKMLNAGLDLAAPNGSETMESLTFMQKMNSSVPGIFDMLDAWDSHSYPNHGFLGKPWGAGKSSVKGFDWELSVLKNTFKVKQSYDVFITETGWPKSEVVYVATKTETGWKKVPTSKFYTKDIVATYIENAFANVWLRDDRVKAITPFVLNYPGELFDEFSWLDKNGNPYPQYESIQKMQKTSWWPDQEEKYELTSITLPPFLPANTKFNGKLILKNIGQSILGEKSKLQLTSTCSGDIKISDLVIPEDEKIKPNQSVTLEFTINSSTSSGNFEFSWSNLPKQKIKVFPSSIIYQARYSLWEKILLKIDTLINF